MRGMKTKSCFKCHEVLPLSEFYAHPQMADGRVNKCKSCNKADVRENYAKRRAQYSAYHAKRDQLPDRKKARLVYAKRMRKSAPEKAKARRMVNYYRRRGVLVPTPCIHCGATENIHGHHRDYSKPLDVIWCCHKCHKTIEHGLKWTETDERRLWDGKRGNRWDYRYKKTT